MSKTTFLISAAALAALADYVLPYSAKLLLWLGLVAAVAFWAKVRGA